jgi:hypothetical protein
LFLGPIVRFACLRKDFPRLSDYHEGECFDFLYTSPIGIKMTKEEFLAHVSAIIQRIDWNPDTPLNLEKSSNRGVTARADTGPAIKQLREIEQELEKNRMMIKEAKTPEERTQRQRFAQRLLEEKARIERDVLQMAKGAGVVVWDEYGLINSSF